MNTSQLESDMVRVVTSKYFEVTASYLEDIENILQTLPVEVAAHFDKLGVEEGLRTPFLIGGVPPSPPRRQPCWPLGLARRGLLA